MFYERYERFEIKAIVFGLAEQPLVINLDDCDDLTGVYSKINEWLVTHVPGDKLISRFLENKDIDIKIYGSPLGR